MAKIKLAPLRKPEKSKPTRPLPPFKIEYVVINEDKRPLHKFGEVEVVFDEWFEIDDGVYCYGCTEKYLTEYLSQCQCGGRPIAYISDWGNVEIECPECETRLICGEGDVQDYLEDWGNMGITQVNQKGKQDIGQHCKQD